MNDATFILLPGMNGTAELFPPFLEAMPVAFKRRVITYPTDTFLDYPSLLKYIEQQVADETKMVVIGESYSGALPLLLAVAHPDRVAAVIMSGAYVSPPWPRFLRVIIRPALLKLRIPSFLIRFFAVGKNASDEVVDKLRDALSVPTPEAVSLRAKEALTMDNTDALRRCSSPILYLAPDQDRLVPPRNLRRILKLKPDVVVQPIPGPHLILQTAPHQAWNAIETFLKQIESH